MTSRRKGVRSGIALAAAIVFVACGGTRDNNYLENADAGVFARLPVDWTVFPSEDGNPVADPRMDLRYGAWRAYVDGAPDPSRSHFEERTPDDPVGVVLVTPLEGTEFEPTFAGLRSLASPDGSDPLAGPVPGLAVEEYDEIDLGHAWGSRITTNYAQPDGTHLKITQLAFIDDGGNRLILFTLGCSAECFDDFSSDIAEVISSFTVEER
jgi:hypothetical protein